MNMQQQLDNCKLALKLWLERVKPEQVIKGLALYRCGTQACFGGHLATWPEFQAMGVAESEEEGAPELWLSPYCYRGQMVAGALFDTEGLFSTRGREEEGTDYEVVVQRLKVQIYRLERALR